MYVYIYIYIYICIIDNIYIYIYIYICMHVLFTLLALCVSSLRRGHADLLCIVPSLTDDPRREPMPSFFVLVVLPYLVLSCVVLLCCVLYVLCCTLYELPRFIT